MLNSQFLKKIGYNLKLETSTKTVFKVVYDGLNISKIIYQYPFLIFFIQTCEKSP